MPRFWWQREKRKMPQLCECSQGYRSIQQGKGSEWPTQQGSTAAVNSWRSARMHPLCHTVCTATVQSAETVLAVRVLSTRDRASGSQQAGRVRVRQAPSCSAVPSAKGATWLATTTTLASPHLLRASITAVRRHSEFLHTVFLAVFWQ